MFDDNYISDDNSGSDNEETTAYDIERVYEKASDDLYNLNDIIKKYINDNAIPLLENMKYSIQNNKTRRIGKVLSERIYIYLSGKDI